MKIFYKALLVFVSVALGLVGSVNVFAAGPVSVNLGSSGNFVILAKTGVSTTGSTSIAGNVGLSPAAASYLTGFALNLGAGSVFSTSSLVSGKIYAPGYADPTPAKIIMAVSDMQTAYTDAMGRANPTATELGAGNIGGMTLAPGLYKWSTGVTIPTDVTLSGGVNDVWIFQIAQNLTTSSATHIILSGGAQASNVFWAVAGQVTLGTSSVFNGNILGQTSIILNTGVSLTGRALAQSAITLDASGVVMPAYMTSTSTSTPTSTTTSSSYTNALGSALLIDSTTSTVPMTSNVAGCSGTSGFSGTTGQSCSGNTTTLTVITPTIIAGCDNRTSGFSTTNGVSCVGNTGSTTTSVSYNLGNSTLKNGSKGESVKQLQKLLNKLLKLGLKEDGTLGPKTITVIKQWQKNHGLVADGLVGAKTKAEMRTKAENN